MRRLYPLADCILVPSAGAADDLASYTGIERSAISVVRSPILSAELAQRAREPVDHPWLQRRQVPVILAAGELGHRKDFATLVRAFTQVRRERPCRLVILGRGRKRANLLALAAELGIADDVDFPGFQANPYAFMARADLFVLSSRWEGMPVVLVEALALHTPVVSTDCPSGPRELLAGTDLGALVPVGAVDAMARAINAWLGAKPPAIAFERAVAAYRTETSACSYLQALGVPCKAGTTDEALAPSLRNVYVKQENGEEPPDGY
jgi:glycosyltransferase involved in cell wall biosynthesis